MDVESNTVKILNLRAAVAAQFIRASSIRGDLLTLLGKATERESSWLSEGADGAERAGIPAAPKARAAGLRNLAVAVIPILVVLITFLFWYSTWFGRPLP